MWDGLSGGKEVIRRIVGVGGECMQSTCCHGCSAECPISNVREVGGAPCHA